MQSEDTSSSDDDLDYLYEKKLQNIGIQKLQVPHKNCNEQCLIFEKLKCVEWSDRCIKKFPKVLIDVNGAIKLLKNRFNIGQKVSIQRKTIQKTVSADNYEKGIKILQKAVINLKQNNYSTRMIAQILRQPKKVIEQLLIYRDLIDESNIIFQIKQYHINWIKKYIKSQIDQIKLSSMNKIFIQFQKEFPQDSRNLKLHQFRRILKQHIKLKFKKPKSFFIPISQSDQVKEQKQYFLDLLSLKQRYINIVYIDETIVNTKIKQRKYWYFQGQDIKRKYIKLQKNISVLGALGDNELFCFQLQIGNNNGASFGTFLNRVFDYATKYYHQQPFAVVLDNSRIHQSKFIKESYLKFVTHLFLARYSPQFNPIELVWQQLKQKIQKFDIDDQLNAPTIIHQCLQEIHQARTNKYIEHTLKVGLKLLTQ